LRRFCFKHRSSSPGRDKNFQFSISFRPALGLTQPPIQLVPGALSPGVAKLATHLQRVPRSRKRGSIHPLPYVVMAQCLVKHGHKFILPCVHIAYCILYNETFVARYHPGTFPIESLAHDNGRTLVRAEYGYPKGSPNTNS
jgi:hypothetical protein